MNKLINITKKHKKTTLFLILFGLLLIFNFQKENILTFITSDAKNLHELAFDTNKYRGYKIYIPENGVLEPYLVATNNFSKQGNVLLVREYLLDEPTMQQKERTGSYYATSIPDDYLSNEFIKQLPGKIQSLIPKTKVVIRDNEKLAGSTDYKKIDRKIFLLNAYEMAMGIKPMLDEERLYIFWERNYQYREPFLIDDFFGKVWKRKQGYWMRSDKSYTDIFTQVITGDGKLSITDIQSLNHIRPSFCLSPELKVEKIKISNQEIYVLKDVEFKSINEKVFEIMPWDKD
ncbi:MAG: DUF6273 domain-containing protein [Streptococcaceae bacterium]|jgi:hypothetical protein|nr:DUF6273 domain-containing protein [Streptococcaceae bacterium]